MCSPPNERRHVMVHQHDAYLSIEVGRTSLCPHTLVDGATCASISAASSDMLACGVDDHLRLEKRSQTADGRASVRCS